MEPIKQELGVRRKKHHQQQQEEASATAEIRERGGRGRSSSNHRSRWRRKKQKEREVEHKFDCSPCSLTVTSLLQLQQHMKGRKHKAKMFGVAGADVSQTTGSTSSSKSNSISNHGHLNLSNKSQTQYSEPPPSSDDFEEKVREQLRLLAEQSRQTAQDDLFCLQQAALLEKQREEEKLLLQQTAIKETGVQLTEFKNTSKVITKAKGHVLPTVVPQYTYKKVLKKYPYQGKKCFNGKSNSIIQSLHPANQKNSGMSTNLGSVTVSQKQEETSTLFMDSKFAYENIITNKIAKDTTIMQPELNHILNAQSSILNSQSNSQKLYNNFSIENILHTGYNNVNNDCLNYYQKKNSQLPYFSTNTTQNPKPVISVRKDLMSPDSFNKVDEENTNAQPILHASHPNIQTHLQTIGKSIFTPLISTQEASLVFGLNSNTPTTQTNYTDLNKAPLVSINNIQNHITLQNIANMSSLVTTSQMKNSDESLKCYTCKKCVFDSAGKSVSLIYDHLFFGRASCKRCSKTVSCTDFTKLRHTGSNCCKSDKLLYTNNPVYYLIGELDNCEKNPRYYLAEYMMKLKLIWIYMPWCQAVVECKNFIKNPYKIPPYLFKGWDENNSPKQTISIKKQNGNKNSERGPLKDKNIHKVNLIDVKKEYTCRKRSLTDKDSEQRETLSPPKKRKRSSLRTLRFKEKCIIDICEVKEEYSEGHIHEIDCTDSMNKKTNVKVGLPDKEIRLTNKHYKNKENIPSNSDLKNLKYSKAETDPNEVFAPKIVGVCSIQSLDDQTPFNTKENLQDNINHTYYSDHYNEKMNIDKDLEESYGSTIMTPDASPVDSTKSATDDLLSKKRLSSDLTNLNSMQGNICVSKYIKDVTRNKANSLVSLKTIEACPMCYERLSLTNLTVNTENLVIKFVCSCNLHIHILPNINGKVLWPFNDHEYKTGERFLKKNKKGPNKRNLRF